MVYGARERFEGAVADLIQGRVVLNESVQVRRVMIMTLSDGVWVWFGIGLWEGCKSSQVTDIHEGYDGHNSSTDGFSESLANHF